jgi:hypothetical protein
VLQSEVNMLKSKNVHQAGMPHGPLSSVDLNIMHQELSQVQIDVKNQIASTRLLTACMGAVAITWHGLTFSSHAETIAWVATKSTPGGYSCFYDVVSLLERVVTVTVTSTKAMDSRYRASRLGLTEMTAKSEAFYFIDIPTVFGKVSADSTSPQFPLPKDAKSWGGEDGVNGVSLTIQNALRAKQSTLTDAIVNAFLGYSTTQRLALMDCLRIPLAFIIGWQSSWVHSIGNCPPERVSSPPKLGCWSPLLFTKISAISEKYGQLLLKKLAVLPIHIVKQARFIGPLFRRTVLCRNICQHPFAVILQWLLC